MLVRVFNDNVHPYTERYRGKTIHIEPKGYVEMDMNEAAHFLGTNPGTAQVDASGIPKPESFKMLRIEKPGDAKYEAPASKKWICHRDGREFPTQAALEKHVLENYMDDLDDEGREKLTKKTAKAKKGVKHDSSANSDGGKAQV